MARRRLSDCAECPVIGELHESSRAAPRKAVPGRSTSATRNSPGYPGTAHQENPSLAVQDHRHRPSYRVD